jgi:molecular chaperone DnaK
MDYQTGTEAELTIGKLVLDCERAKKDLYKEGVNETSITMEYKGGVITETITRAQYEDITKEETNLCKVCCDKILSEAKMTWDNIDTVLMVGSMSNCESIQNALRKWSGRDILFGFINPKTCVSEGAAICAFLHEGGSTVKTLKDNLNYDKIEEGFCLAEDISKAEESGERVETKIAFATSVISGSIRLKGFVKGTPTALLFLEKNTTYPTSKSTKVPIGRDDLSEVKIEILEGETDNPANCTVLGDAVLPLRGKHSKNDLVEVTIKVDNNGIIQTEGVDIKTGEKVDASIRRQGALSKEEIDKAKDAIEDMFTLSF